LYKDCRTEFCNEHNYTYNVQYCAVRHAKYCHIKKLSTSSYRHCEPTTVIITTSSGLSAPLTLSNHSCSSVHTNVQNSNLCFGLADLGQSGAGGGCVHVCMAPSREWEPPSAFFPTIYGNSVVSVVDTANSAQCLVIQVVSLFCGQSKCNLMTSHK
jgi:hypothetical protein